MDRDVLDHLIVKVLSVVARPPGQTQDRVQADSTQPAGGPHPGPFDQMLGDLQDLVRWELGAEQRGAAALREALAAGRAAEATDALGLAGPAVRAKIVAASLAIGLTGSVGASEGRPVLCVHGDSLPGSLSRLSAYQDKVSDGRRMASPPRFVLVSSEPDAFTPAPLLITNAPVMVSPCFCTNQLAA